MFPHDTSCLSVKIWQNVEFARYVNTCLGQSRTVGQQQFDYTVSAMGPLWEKLFGEQDVSVIGG